jgi:hypothetical protein
MLVCLIWVLLLTGAVVWSGLLFLAVVFTFRRIRGGAGRPALARPAEEDVTHA